MIKRIVKMTFRPDATDEFENIFKEKKDLIRSFEGCNHLELWQSVSEPAVFFTYSYWESEADLENYRHSDLFRSTWKRTKALFDNRPQAWSVKVIGNE